MYFAHKNDAGTKLGDYLRLKWQGRHSARLIKRFLESNHCKVNGKVERFYSYPLKERDRIEADENAIISTSKAKFEKERVLYEDDNLLIYNKPTGLSSDQQGLGALFPEFILVHRLDKETSGIILLAKDQKIADALIELFKQQKVQKVYLALVDRVPDPDRGVIENRLVKMSDKEGDVRWGSHSSGRGLMAKTIWNVEKKGPVAALVKCLPVTGRTHQIRVHMHGMGHPLLGDYRYSKKFTCPYHAKRCMLHAYEISFPHPVTGETVQLKCTLPPDFKEAMKQVIA